MRVELLTSKDTVKHQSCVWQTTGLNGQWSNGSRVCCVRSSQPWKGRVVVRAICGPVGVFWSHVPALSQHLLNQTEPHKTKTYDNGGCGNESQSSSRNRFVSSTRFLEPAGRPLTSYTTNPHISNCARARGKEPRLSTYLNNSLHEHSLVINQFARRLALDEIL